MSDRRLRGMVAAAAAVTLVFGMSGGLPAVGQPTATLVYVRSADSNYLDPGFTTITEDLDVGVNIFDNLLRTGPSGEAEPGLATSWSNLSGRVWTFKLRAGAKFTDGTPVDAAAVAFSFNRLSPDSQFYAHGRDSSLGIWLGDLIVHADVVDPSTVRITLKNPYALLPDMLAAWPVPIVSPTAVQKLGDQFPLQPVGSGPYRLGEWVKGDHITLLANAGYWGSVPAIGRIIFKIVPDPSSRLLELRRGSGDFLKGMGPDQRDAVTSDPTLTLLTKPCSCIGYVAINDQKKPFDNVLVRRALNYAIDRSTIMRTIEGGLGVVAESMVPPWMPGYNPNVAKYPYDPAKAKSLLAEAGFPSGFPTELWTFNVERPFIPNILVVAQRVQSDLAAVGVNAKLSVMDSSVYWGSINGLKGDLAMKGWYTPPQADFLISVALLGEQSATYYPDTPHGQQLRAMAKTAEQTFDPAARARIYQQIQRIYMEDAPIVPLMHPAYAWVYRRGPHRHRDLARRIDPVRDGSAALTRPVDVLPGAPRWRRLRELMATLGVDALVATSPSNVRYVTGFALTMESLELFAGGHPLFGILGDRGGPVLVAPVTDLVPAVFRGIRARLVPYGRNYVVLPDPPARLDAVERAVAEALGTGAPAAAAVAAAAAVLRDAGVRRVGIDDGGPASLVRELASALPDVETVPAASAFRQARAVKEPDEIEGLRRAAEIVEAAMDEVWRHAQSGVSEIELARCGARVMVDAGARPTLWYVGVGTASALVDRLPTARAAHVGDPSCSTSDARLGGYYADLARTAVLGPPSPRLAQYYDAVHAGETAGIEGLRAGRVAAEVFREAIRAARDAGIPHFDRRHVGHGIGLDPYDLPMLTADADTVLEAGTVLNIETPYYELGFGGLQLEDTLVVRPAGVEWLSRAPRELREL